MESETYTVLLILDTSTSQPQDSDSTAFGQFARAIGWALEASLSLYSSASIATATSTNVDGLLRWAECLFETVEAVCEFSHNLPLVGHFYAIRVAHETRKIMYTSVRKAVWGWIRLLSAVDTNVDVTLKAINCFRSLVYACEKTATVFLAKEPAIYLMGLDGAATLVLGASILY